MPETNTPIRVLYSFPHKIGAARICHIAWKQVEGLSQAGAEVFACPGVLHRPLPDVVCVRPTLGRGALRIPYKLIGKMRALALHDWIVARRLESMADQIDVVHAWPAAALQTLETAARVGIPTVLERPNAHTRFAFEVVGKEFDRIGVTLPPSDEYFYRADLLEREEKEYNLADYILCPSNFVVKTFEEQGITREKLLRHQYGFDEKVYFPTSRPLEPGRGLTMLFVGVCAVRKGVHFALEAWLNSPASENGTFLIAGEFLSGYADRLSSMLSHPSVKVLGHRNDIPDLMRNSDILVLPSIEEGFGLVVAEAIGSGCVPLVSDACTDICRHMANGLVHRRGDVATLSSQITSLHQNRELLGNLRAGAIRMSHEVTWTAAGVRLLEVYREAIRRGPRSEIQSGCRAEQRI